ncbi:MAG TPA: NIPSNAP family protein [Burkholderiaceae bacterium]|nr:NIPSNAP family protein [Burkholderiaceae bacterium]
MSTPKILRTNRTGPYSGSEQYLNASHMLVLTELSPFYQSDASMIYELRVYTAMPGRLADVLARFRDHTVDIWNRLGIRQLGYWTTAIGPDSNALTYMLVWDSMADREAKWGKFVADPEWVRVRTASEASGPIVAKMDSSFLTPTSFSPLK